MQTSLLWLLLGIKLASIPVYWYTQKPILYHDIEWKYRYFNILTRITHHYIRLDMCRYLLFIVGTLDTYIVYYLLSYTHSAHTRMWLCAFIPHIHICAISMCATLKTTLVYSSMMMLSHIFVRDNIHTCITKVSL